MAALRSRLTWPAEEGWRHLGAAILISAAAAMVVLLLFVGRWLTFWYDEWDFIFNASNLTLSSLLQPHVDHLSTVPILIYQGLLLAFGLGSYLPFLVVTWALHLASVFLLFRLVGRVAGPFPGLLAALSLLALGSAFENLLQAFQLSFLASTTAGLFALVLLVRHEDELPARSGRLAAGVALTTAVASSSVGVLFLGLALLYVALGGDRRSLVATLPVALLYGAWYLTWGRASRGPADLGSADPLAVGSTFLFGVGAAVAGMLGLPPERFGWVGLAAAVLAVGAAAALTMAGHRPRPSALGLAAAAALAAEYALQAIFRSDFGVEHAARSAYLYPGVIFIWVLIADVIRSTRGPVGYPSGRPVRGTRALIPYAISLAMVAGMIFGNLLQFVGAARAMRDLRATQIEELRFMETVRSVPGIVLATVPDQALMPQVTVGSYVRAIDAFGSPAADFVRDPKANVDWAAVATAALRVLEPASQAVSEPTASGPPPTVTHGDASIVEQRGSCVVFAPAQNGLRAAVQYNGVPIFAAGDAISSTRVLVEITGLPPIESANLTKAVQSGAALAMPELPSGLGWTVIFVGTGSQLSLCSAAPG